MSRILDDSLATDVAEVVVDALNESGFSPEESIPGLILAVANLASMIPDREGALDEAANLLADTGEVA